MFSLHVTYCTIFLKYIAEFHRYAYDGSILYAALCWPPMALLYCPLFLIGISWCIEIVYILLVAYSLNLLKYIAEFHRYAYDGSILYAALCWPPMALLYCPLFLPGF